MKKSTILFFLAMVSGVTLIAVGPDAPLLIATVMLYIGGCLCESIDGVGK